MCSFHVVSEETLKSRLNSLEGGVRKLEKVLETYQSKDEEDKFLEIMSEFVSSSKEQCTLLVEMHKNMQTTYKELLSFFSMGSKKVAIEEFFGDIHTFLKQYEVRTSLEIDMLGFIEMNDNLTSGSKIKENAFLKMH